MSANPADGMNDYLRAVATFAKVRGLDRQAIFETLMDDIYFSHAFPDEMLRMGYLNALLDGMGRCSIIMEKPESAPMGVEIRGPVFSPPDRTNRQSP